MKKSSKLRLAKSAIASTLAAMVMLPSVAQADVVAQSILFLTSFRIVPLLDPGEGFTGNVIYKNSGSAAATLNGVSSVGTQGATVNNFTLKRQVGISPGFYVPGTPLLGAPTSTYAGSFSSITGNALNPSITASARLDNTVSLNPQGDGVTSSSTNLSSTFELNNVGDGAQFLIDFNARGVLRASLDPAPFVGQADANYKWSARLKNNSTNEVVFTWDPDGNSTVATGQRSIVGGLETADAFNLGDDVVVQVGGFPDDIRGGIGRFTATTNRLAGGNYTLSVVHTSGANASLVIPEPGSMALLGLGLVGLAAIRRRTVK